ncbi:hypothetical protein BJV77DRAFT_1148857 [Russula vinacea]|nr:hypothetical protein BJV77DRAFT_1148857 [Russula vinacea]
MFDAPVPSLTDLHMDELAELMRAIQHVGRVVERAYKADGLTIACQDGVASGQTCHMSTSGSSRSCLAFCFWLKVRRKFECPQSNFLSFNLGSADGTNRRFLGVETGEPTISSPKESPFFDAISTFRAKR